MHYDTWCQNNGPVPQRKVSTRSSSTKEEMCWHPCHVAKQWIPHLGLWDGLPSSASYLWLFLSRQLRAVFLFLCTTSQAQPSWCCLGLSNLLEHGCMHQKQARAKLKRASKEASQPLWEQVHKDLLISHMHHQLVMTRWQPGCSGLFTLFHISHQPGSHPMCAGGERSERQLPCEGHGIRRL